MRQIFITCDFLPFLLLYSVVFLCFQISPKIKASEHNMLFAKISVYNGQRTINMPIKGKGRQREIIHQGIAALLKVFRNLKSQLFFYLYQENRKIHTTQVKQQQNNLIVPPCIRIARTYSSINVFCLHIKGITPQIQSRRT